MIGMRLMGAAGALSALLAAPAAGQREMAPGPEPAMAVTAPAPWLAQDPGDSLYRAGRGALNRAEYREAVRHFRGLRDRFPRSGYVGDAYYWEAFALSKMAGKEDLRNALTLLDRQAERFPEARTGRDARELRVRVQGELARLGDAASAAAVAEAVAPLSPPPAGVPPVAAVPSVGAPPATPTPPRGVSRGVGRGEGRGQSRRSECRDEDDERLIAINALMNMDAERAIPILRSVLEKRDEGSVCLRRQAVFLLSQKRSPETARVLLDAARNDPDPEVRENAVFWLSQVNTPEATAALDSILQHGADRQLQEKAVFALSQQKSELAARALRDHLERAGTPDDIKENIIFWLGQGGGRSSETAQYLKDFYARPGTSGALKEKIIFSLSQMNIEENARWLIGIAQNERENIEVRKNALFWAGQMSRVPFAELGGMYDRVQNRDMKEQLIFVYSQRRESEAVDKLMAIVRTETDRELRKNAMFWLGQSRDPRVADFLLEMINR